MEKINNPQQLPRFSRDELAKIHYQCRRGMLELDVFLMSYFEHCFVELSEPMQDLFIVLLEEPDPDLFNWLMGHSEAGHPYEGIIKDITTFQLSGAAK